MRNQNNQVRFQVRQNNFVFHVFDTVQYRAVTSRNSRKAAEVEAAKRNAR